MRQESQWATDLFYLAFDVWREGRGEPRAGKLAIAFSILDRVRNPKWWRSTVATVVTAPKQYSSMTFPGDPNLVLYPVDVGDGAVVWEECLEVANCALRGLAPNPVPAADSYYAAWMDKKGGPPPWAKPSQFVAQVGAHKFFNTDGSHPDNTPIPGWQDSGADRG